MTPQERALAERLSREIRRERLARQWSQAELAEKLEVSVGYVGLMERGERLPAAGTLVELVRVLGLSIDALAIEKRAAGWEAEALAALRAVPEALRPTILAMVRGGSGSTQIDPTPNRANVRKRRR